MRNLVCKWLCPGLVAIPTLALAQAPTPDPRLRYVFEETVLIGDTTEFGTTALGKRFMVPIVGGEFAGPGIRGQVVPGGWDWQLARGDGCIQIEANYMLRTDDGVMINVLNKGAFCTGPDGKPVPVRTSPVFEVPRGKYEWLGQTAFVGTLDVVQVNGKDAVRIRFFRAD